MDCIIIASGGFTLTSEIEAAFNRASCIICADGGAAHLRKINRVPHVLLGDFDSIAADDLSFFQNKNVTCIDYPARKNQTDSELCVDWAIENDADFITLVGVTGSRMDHSLANLFLLKKLLDKGIPARIIDEKNEIHMIDDQLTLKGDQNDYVSLIPVSDRVDGITLTGLEYQLKNATITMGSTLGISNRFRDKTAMIEIKKGILMVTRSKD